MAPSATGGDPSSGGDEWREPSGRIIAAAPNDHGGYSAGWARRRRPTGDRTIPLLTTPPVRTVTRVSPAQKGYLSTGTTAGSRTVPCRAAPTVGELADSAR